MTGELSSWIRVAVCDDSRFIQRLRRISCQLPVSTLRQSYLALIDLTPDFRRRARHGEMAFDGTGSVRWALETGCLPPMVI